MESINDIELIKEFESVKELEPIEKIEPNEEFGLHIMVTLKYYLLGSFMLLAGFLLLTYISRLYIVPFLISMLFFGIAILYSKHKIVKIYDDYFELKTRFFSTAKEIKNSKFIAYSIDEDELTISYKEEDATVGEFIIKESSMVKEDLDELLVFLLTIKK